MKCMYSAWMLNTGIEGTAAVRKSNKVDKIFILGFKDGGNNS